MTEPCGAQYGSNPDRCYQPSGHDGTHSNQYGTTWAAPDDLRGWIRETVKFETEESSR